MSDFMTDNLRVFVVPVQVLYDSNLSANEKLIYMTLRSFANPHNETVWPSISTIVKLSSLSKMTVIRTIEKLEQKQYIKREHKFEYNPDKKSVEKKRNHYTLDLPSTTERLPLVPQGDYPSTTERLPLVPQGDYPSTTQVHIKDLEKRSKEKDIKKDDDDRESVANFIFESFENKISRENFNVVFKRVHNHVVIDFAAYLKKSVETEIEMLKAKAALPKREPVARSARSQANSKPEIPLASGQAEQVTEDELEEYRRLARKIDSDNSGRHKEHDDLERIF